MGCCKATHQKLAPNIMNMRSCLFSTHNFCPKPATWQILAAPNVRCFDNTLEKHDLEASWEVKPLLWHFCVPGFVMFEDFEGILNIHEFIQFTVKQMIGTSSHTHNGPCHLVIQACGDHVLGCQRFASPGMGAKFTRRTRLQWSYQKMPWLSIAIADSHTVSQMFIEFQGPRRSSTWFF